MKIFTINDIRAWSPCYDPIRYLPEGWSGTAVEVLARKDIPAEDRAWVVFREELIDEKTLRLFAVWCGRQALKTIENPDFRLMNACDVAEQFAMGEATEEELSSAWDDAWVAARAAARAAVRDAARVAAASDADRDAGWSAAREAAWAARAAAWAAVKEASKEAAWAAAKGAAWAASDAARAAAKEASKEAAWAAASDAAWDAQLEQLSKIIQKQNN